MKYQIKLQSPPNLTALEKQMAVETFLKKQFGRGQYFSYQIDQQWFAAKNQAVFETWQQNQLAEIFIFELDEEILFTFYDRFPDCRRKRQFERLVCELEECLKRPASPLRITEQKNRTTIEQFHFAADGPIGYFFEPYQEGINIQASAATCLWVYEEDFVILYQGLKLLYPRQEEGFETFDPTGMNPVTKQEWPVVLREWQRLKKTNPSSAAFLNEVEKRIKNMLQLGEEIWISGNL
ncbi:hypothetical protein [Listeria costaricensis]|uniref:hypothetical protein n=1 Tax=Listeria costaricensis TaxID=2026604 RepID=UPI000C086494|nr:hypothetical protein [Listeria costaricensis]